jgi:hypothetical protein
MSSHQCSSCHCHLHGTRQTGSSNRCSACVRTKTAKNGKSTRAQTERRNDAHRASFATNALDHPFAQGSFRWVARGKFTEGNRAGEACVCKWFKSGGVLESHFYDKDLAASNEAIRRITQWNSGKYIDRVIKVNKPEVWTFTRSCSAEWAGKKVLQEPFISDYQKFNSNSGWKDDSIPWSRVMQAVSHFTYHFSNGERLLCDLQGGIYNNGVILTDPVVMSNTAGAFGPTDLGPDGISTFFARHRCSEYCGRQWRKPNDRTAYFRLTAGTTMQHVPTQHSRNRMTTGLRK